MSTLAGAFSRRRLIRLLCANLPLSLRAVHWQSALQFKPPNLPNTTAINANCTFTGSGFTNTYDPIVTNASTPVKDATASITYTCTNGGTGAKIALNDGTNAASGSTDDSPLARLKGGTHGDYLNYTMYQDNGYSEICAYDPAVNEVSATEDGAQHIATVYTEIPAGQNVHVDTYTDTVTATIAF